MEALSDLPTTFTRQGTSTALTPLQAATIQLYNRGAVPVSLPNAFGNDELMRSCWEFDPSASVGSRWTFVPNSIDFVKKVIFDEFEGNAPISE